MTDFLNLPSKEVIESQNIILQTIADKLGVTTGALQDAINLANQATIDAENKIVDVENRFQTLTTEQQQDAEVIDARQGKTSLVANIQDIKEAFDEHKAENVSQIGGVHGLEIEEGTFTPEYTPENGEFEDIRYISTEGQYLRIGNIVYITMQIITSDLSLGNASGSLRITGLPFKPSFRLSALSTAKYYRFKNGGVSSSGGEYLHAVTNENNYLDLYINDIESYSFLFLTVEDMSTLSGTRNRMCISGMYFI